MAAKPIHSATNQDLVRNAQHVGAGRSAKADASSEAGATSRKPETARTDDNAAQEDRVMLAHSDASHLEGAENAAHTGQLQEEARKDGEPALEPAPENRVAGLLEGPKEEARNLPVPVSSSPGVPAVLTERLDEASAGGPGGPAGPGQMPPGGGGQMPPGGGTAVPSGANSPEQAEAFKKWQADQQQVQSIFMQMAADRQKWMMEMWKIIQDTQNAIYKIMEEAILYKAQVYNKVNAAWSAVIRGATE